MNNNAIQSDMETLLLALKKMEQETQDTVLSRLLESPALADVIRSVIKEEQARSKMSRVKEYMHMDYFLKEYRISKKTFHAWKKNVYVHSRQQGRYKVYNVVQFEQAARSPKNYKPDFEKAA